MMGIILVLAIYIVPVLGVELSAGGNLYENQIGYNQNEIL